MKFTYPLIHGRLVKRYKRFLADVTLDDGTLVTAHCTNSGSMLSCLEEGAEVWLSPAEDPRRKTRFTWEMIWINGEWVGREMVPGLEGLTGLRREVKWEDSRFDLYGEMAGSESTADSGSGAPDIPGKGCFIEVKNVSLKEGDRALFPDSVTERGRKHLNTLIRVKKAGMRAVMLYVVQRMDVRIFSPARSIDPAYGKALDEAIRNGVEIIVVQARITPESMEYHGTLPVEL